MLNAGPAKPIPRGPLTDQNQTENKTKDKKDRNRSPRTRLANQTRISAGPRVPFLTSRSPAANQPPTQKDKTPINYVQKKEMTEKRRGDATVDTGLRQLRRLGLLLLFHLEQQRAVDVG